MNAAIAGGENGAEGLATTLPTASELTTAPELGDSETTGLLACDIYGLRRWHFLVA